MIEPIQPRTYQSTRANRIFLRVLALGGGLIAVSMLVQIIRSLLSGENSLGDNLLLLFIVVLMGFGVYALFEQSTISLVVSERGLEYHRLGMQFFTPWENLDRIEFIHSNSRVGSYASLHLKQPAELLNSRNWPGSDNLTKMDVSPFWQALTEGDLADYIRQYAPKVQIPHHIKK